MKPQTKKARTRGKMSPIALGVALALAAPGLVFAEDAAQAAPEKSELNLDAIVVTATGNQKSKLESSISVTDVDSALVEALNPQTQSEVFRLIPGMIVQGAAGPGGNQNISVRGLPIVTGGSPFVQIQEDGLPTVLFGDMNFGNNDYWTRFDVSNRVESVRGGSASTLASGAPGAVINYVSDTGTKKGGEFTFSNGLGHDLKRATFAVGAPLSDTWRFHADGFFEIGKGVRDEGFQAQRGYQIKANVTHDIDARSYVRLYLKLLDDQSPTWTSFPFSTSGSSNQIGGVSPFPGYDARKGSSIGVYNQSFGLMDVSTGQISQVPSSGIHPVAHAVGSELHYVTDGGVTLDDKFRFTQMSGTFSTQFGGYRATSDVLKPGNLVNGLPVNAIVYGAGPNAGHAYTGQYLVNNAQIYSNMGDMGSTVNDLAVSDKWLFGEKAGALSARGGLFYMSQNIAQDWHPNAYYQTLEGTNPVPLDLISGTSAAAATLLSINGTAGYNSNWGTCCARMYDMKVADTAPYIDLTYDVGSLQLDASARRDYIDVTGWAENASGISQKSLPTNFTSYNFSAAGTTFHSALVSYAVLDPATLEPLNYRFQYTSYSLGALYLLTDNTSVFVRASRGGKANTDRNILSGYTNPDGGLNSSGSQKTTDIVYQQEAGVKTRGNLGATNYGIEATVFHNSFSQSNFDLTQCNSGGTCGQYSASSYSSTGLELEGSLNFAGLGLVGQLTWTHANIDQNANCYGAGCTLASGTTGVAPAGTTKLTYMLAPTYSVGPFMGALVIQGQGKMAIDNNGSTAPGFTILDLTGRYEVAKNMFLGISVNNLFNKLAINGQSDNNANGSLVTATALAGRVIDASLTVRF